MNIWGITDPGKVRKQNQDSFYQWNDDTYGCVVVCDGMGGAKAGNVASALAGQHFAEVVSQAGEPDARLTKALAAANEAVYTRGKIDATCLGMGTTLVAALVKGQEAHIINVGDSRCYHVSQGTIRKVTRDHSWVETLVELGQLTPEEARTHPNRNIITRALGTEAKVEGDLYLETILPGDQLLFCSDGLSNEVRPEEMLEILQTSTPVASCDALLRLALERGAPDNVTVVVLATAGTGI
jgi:protein phosphatase